MTVEEVLALPDEKPAFELIEGVVSRKISPTGEHGGLQGEWFWPIESRIRGARLGRTFPETRLVLDGRVLVPDLMVYRWDRVPRDADGRLPSIFNTPPDLVVEISSPGQSTRAQADHCRWLVARNVRLAVLVQPRTRTVRLFRADGETEEIPRRGVIDLAPALPGVTLELEPIFGATEANPDQAARDLDPSAPCADCRAGRTGPLATRARKGR
ncbi:MAG: Uma2 family endonuclease [Chloroflexota bacterium]